MIVTMKVSGRVAAGESVVYGSVMARASGETKQAFQEAFAELGDGAYRHPIVMVALMAELTDLYMALSDAMAPYEYFGPN